MVVDFEGGALDYETAASGCFIELETPRSKNEYCRILQKELLWMDEYQ